MENLKTSIEVDKTNGQLANAKTLPENKEMQEHQIIFDPLGIPFCLDCAVATQAATINPYNLPNPTTIPSSN